MFGYIVEERVTSTALIVRRLDAAEKDQKTSNRVINGNFELAFDKIKEQEKEIENLKKIISNQEKILRRLEAERESENSSSESSKSSEISKSSKRSKSLEPRKKEQGEDEYSFVNKPE